MTKNTNEAHAKLLAELLVVLADTTHTAARDRIELRDAVCQYVNFEHTRGTPLQSVLKTVKEILIRAEKEAGHESEELAQQLVDWCLEFHPGSSSKVSSKLHLVS